ncbi:MAG: DUF1800 family protein [Bacteroidia bacterium]|nr:DUF1800 family protein [Bacteroidia bacterium]
MASLAINTGPLGRRLAAHLLRRTTLGPTRAEIELYAGKSADEAVELLMNLPPQPGLPMDPLTGLTWVETGRTPANSPNEDLKLMVNSWWLHHALRPDQGPTIAHKLLFFLHTSFVTAQSVVDFSENYYYTLRLFLLYLDGSYKTLAQKICLDNGMNDFLDIGDSEVNSPNENFVREFLELFTIGKGITAGPGDYTTFTEQDVTEAARLMTGFRRNDTWGDITRWDPETGLPRAIPDPARHDLSSKTFSHRFQNQVIPGRTDAAGMLEEVADFVNMIFAQPETARQIVRRLYRYFVRYRISAEVENDIILPLADTFIAQNFELMPVLRQLLKSQHFYDTDDAAPQDEVIGSLFKSPLELQAGMIRYFQVPIPDPATDVYAAYVSFFQWSMQQPMSDACFDLFDPPEVAGYQPVYQAPEYNRLWISAKSLPARYAMADLLTDGPANLYVDLMAFVSDPAHVPDFTGIDPAGNNGTFPGARIASHLVTELLTYLLPEFPDNDRYTYFLADVLLDGLTPLNWMMEWDLYLSSGDDTNVRPQVERLIRAILQSPEYQLM